MTEVKEYPELTIITQSLNVVMISSRKELYKLAQVEEVRDPNLGTYYIIGNRVFNQVCFTGHSGSCYIYRALECKGNQLPNFIEFRLKRNQSQNPSYINRWI